MSKARKPRTALYENTHPVDVWCSLGPVKPGEKVRLSSDEAKLRHWWKICRKSHSHKAQNTEQSTSETTTTNLESSTPEQFTLMTQHSNETNESESTEP